MAISQISGEDFKRFFNEKYLLVCQLLDCQAFQSWHTPSKSEWGDVLTAITRMLKKCDWPLYDVKRNGDDASSLQAMNTGLMMNDVHNLLDALDGYGAACVPLPGQWGDIMRVVDETTARRDVIDRAGSKESK